MSNLPHEIRKQVYGLLVDDLRRFPIWEFASDEEGDEGQDEATVRPWRGVEPPDPTTFVVRARFVLGDGTVHIGYVTQPAVPGDTALNVTHPVIVTDQGQVAFWFGVLVPSRERMDAAYAKLDRPAERAFPIQYTSDSPLAGGVVSGFIDGFCCYRSSRDRTIVTLR